jgi:thiosulfate reductase / polysulfide reductase chain A
LKTRVHLTEGIHPMALAIAHNNGRWVGGLVASNRAAPEGFLGFGPPDRDIEQNLWWSRELSVPQNGLIPIYPDPRTGQQAWHDTLVRVRKLGMAPLVTAENHE